jgi:acyl carrier protein
MSKECQTENEADDLDARVRAQLAVLLRVEPGRVRPEARLAEDLKVDSLEFLTVVVELERVFGIMIPDREAARLTTVGQTVEAVRRYAAPDPLGAAALSSPSRGAA